MEKEKQRQEAERKKKEGEDIRQQGETRKGAEETIVHQHHHDERMDLPALGFPPPTPITRDHFPLSELGLPNESEDEVLDLTRISLDHFSHKIKQEMRKYIARNPSKPLSVSTENEIVPDTTVNPEMVASKGATFVAMTEMNVRRMKIYIEKL